MCVERGAARGGLLLLLSSAAVYMLFVHDRVDYTLLPWNRTGSPTADGGHKSWDEEMAEEVASSLDMRVSAAELFPEQLAAQHAAVGMLEEPPGEEGELEEWVKQVRKTKQEMMLNNTLADKWQQEVDFFAGLRTEQDAEWMQLERRLNALYGWYTDFYAAMLASKLHVNSMHVAPEPGEATPEPTDASEAVLNGAMAAVGAGGEGTEELQPLLEPSVAEQLTETFNVSDTSDLLARASALSSAIDAKHRSISFVRQQLKGYRKQHKADGAVLDKLQTERFPHCESSLQERRQVLLELHTFLDSIFKHMSDALEAARVEALRIRNSPHDNRPAQEEVLDLQDKMAQRSPEISHMLARVVPEARDRAAHLKRLDVTLIDLEQRAAEVDGLMSNVGNTAGALVRAFKATFQHANNLSQSLSLMEECRKELEGFADSFEQVMKQEAVATGIVRLAGELDELRDALHPVARETVAGLALQLQSLDRLDRTVVEEVHQFRKMMKAEKRLHDGAAKASAYPATCRQYVRAADLALTSGRAMIMKYYAAHGLYHDASDGIPDGLRHLDTHDPHPPSAAREVKYDYQEAAADVSLRFWWRASPPPPPLSPSMG
mmetsp:Transcript_38372/g.98098  ORF Transcript_38372/g.98098 Transcript_38372/m.98098 type:complete len:605 (+) Transcript_38372:180-1994(+)